MTFFNQIGILMAEFQRTARPMTYRPGPWTPESDWTYQKLILTFLFPFLYNHISFCDNSELIRSSDDGRHKGSN